MPKGLSGNASWHMAQEICAQKENGRWLTSKEHIQMIEGNRMGVHQIVKCKFAGMQGGLVNEGNDLKIAVCDDMVRIANAYGDAVERVLRQLGVKGEVVVYTKAEELLSNQAGYDIIFLDIEMPDCNSLQMARELRKKKTYGKIIFMTNYSQYIQEAYKVQPFRYLYKSDPEEWIRDAIADALEECKERDGILLESDGRIYPVFLDDILYIEALGDEVAIILARGERYIVRTTLKAIYGLLENRFVKCSRGVLINLKHIFNIGDMSITLNGDIEIPMSYREKRNVKQKYIEYVKKLVKW